MNFEKIKDENKIYCLDSKNTLVDNDIAIDYEVKQRGVYVNLASIKKGQCFECEFFNYYIKDKDKSRAIDYILTTVLDNIYFQMINELEILNFGAKIVENDNKYVVSYGFELDNHFIEFKKGSGDYNFEAIDNPLNSVIISKMKDVLNSY